MLHQFLSVLIISLVIIVATASIIPEIPKHDKVVVCYVASWATYRPQRGSFGVEHMRPELCTHIVYAFAGLNTSSWSIKSLDNFLDTSDDYGRDNYKKMTALRSRNPGLKVTLAIGGWNEGSSNYSALASSKSNRAVFISSVIAFLKKFNFDGLDLDWEFPARRGGSPNDKENFVALVQELSNAFRPHGFILTAAISADKATINDAYDIPRISDHLDYIHVMTYDYHGTWNGRVLANAPLDCDDGLCIKETIKHLLSKGAKLDKLVLGLAMYGRTFILTSKPNSTVVNPIGMQSLDKGFRGPFTQEDGFMGYNEICDALQKDASWTIGWDEKSSVPYAIKDDRVIVYDNPKSIKLKIEYAKKMNLAGVMVWAIDNDDFHGDCANQHTEIQIAKHATDFPLMRTINFALAQKSDDSENEIYDSKTHNSSSSIYSYVTFVITSLLLLSFRL